MIFNMTLLTDLLAQSTQRFSSQPALTMRMGFRTTTLTYQQVYDLACRVALLLDKHQLNKGDPVIICAPNSPYWVVVLWGCLLRGCPVVPLAPQNTQTMLQLVAQQTNARLFFKARSVRHVLPDVVTYDLENLFEGEGSLVLNRRSPPFGLKQASIGANGSESPDHPESDQECKVLSSQKKPFAPMENPQGDSPSHFGEGSNGGGRRQPIAPTNLALIMYTSGTTGDPKGVMLTHGNIMSDVLGAQELLSLQSDHERLLSVLPLSHMFELTVGLFLPYLLGAHIIYAHSHGAIRELLQTYRITKMAAVPEFLAVMRQQIYVQAHDNGKTAMLNRMFALAACMPLLRPYSAKASKGFVGQALRRLVCWPVLKKFGGRLNTIACGGSALEAPVETFWDNLGVTVLQGYGLTETSPILTGNTFAHRRLGSVGKPLPMVSMRLSKDNEIEVTGPNITPGYFQHPAKTAEVFTSDGWLKTGDIGYCDNDGFWFLKGRQRFMIKGPGAQNIFPEDIEAVLHTLPGVADACVVGLTTPAGQLEIHAAFLLKDDALISFGPFETASGLLRVSARGEELRKQRLEPRTSASSTLDHIVQQANQQLASYQHITGWSIWPQDDFPRTVTRKIKRGEVIAYLQQHGNKQLPTGAHAAVTKLITLLAQVSRVDSVLINGDTRLGTDLKFDSLMRIECITRIEEQYGILIDERLMTAQTTVAELETIIATAKPLTKMPRVKAWPRAWWARLLRMPGRGMISLVTTCLFNRIRVEGLEHLAGINGPVIIMPNHVSLIDGLVVMAALPPAIKKRISFAAAYDVLYEEYRTFAWLAELFFNAFPFPRHEHEHIATGLLNMGTMLDAGYNVVVFPEGRMSRDGNLSPLKAGAGLIALEMKAPVVPVKIIGLAGLVPYDHFLPRSRGSITVKIGKPMHFDAATSYQEAVALLDRAIRDL